MGGEGCRGGGRDIFYAAVFIFFCRMRLNFDAFGVFAFLPVRVKFELKQVTRLLFCALSKVVEDSVTLKSCIWTPRSEARCWKQLKTFHVFRVHGHNNTAVVHSSRFSVNLRRIPGIETMAPSSDLGSMTPQYEIDCGYRRDFNVTADD